MNLSRYDGDAKNAFKKTQLHNHMLLIYVIIPFKCSRCREVLSEAFASKKRPFAVGRMHHLNANFTFSWVQLGDQEYLTQCSVKIAAELIR